MKKLLTFGFAALLAGSAHAAVTLTFDTTAQGFTNVSWNANGGAAWSAQHGGSLELTSVVSGWSNPVGVLSPLGIPALQTEFQNALLYGGTLSFDYIVSQADIAGYNAATPPGWFELVAFGNSDGAAGGGWDQNVLGGAAGYYGGIPTGPSTVRVTLGIAAGPPAADNNALSFGATSPWAEIMFGFNNQSSGLTGAKVYLDNMTLTANPIPEPTAAGLGLLALGSLTLRRRRGA
jgi:MYXO-CTERM domain-containing protein